MKRRDFVALLASVALAAPLPLRAQEPGRVYRLGALLQSQRQAPNYAAFFDKLRSLGFVEGKNLEIDKSGFGLRPEQMAAHAAEIVKTATDVIVAAGDVAIKAAQQVTTAIPILGVSEDLVGAGLVRSLAKPGANTTGVSILSPELDGKRQQFLTELVPGARRLAALADSNTTSPAQLQALQDAAGAQGVELIPIRVTGPGEIVAAVDAAKASGAAGLSVLASPLFFANRRSLIERCAALRLPAFYHLPEFAEDGGLIAYGPRIVRVFGEQLAPLLAKLLLGEKPADLPVEQPTRFELVINAKAAKALGIEIPLLLLARADEVIE